MGEEVEEYWKNNENVAIIDFLDDMNPIGPYTCAQWGSVGDQNHPIIIDDEDFNFRDEFHDIYPTNVFIDHEMRVHAILDTLFTAGSVNVKIQEMLNAAIFGCTESDACNYNPDAITDDGSCEYIADVCGICGGSEADENNCLGIYNDFTVAKQFQIQQLYPNPFNPVLNININLAWAGMTQVNIMDIAGAHIETLHSGFLHSGRHELIWNAESMPSGVYFISLKLGNKNLTEKVVLLK